ncbi:ATP-binding cassette domain-containing protein [Microbacterium sp. TNHR37B]|uniref:ATP-binding cassette domain-containing protein n=1 Tax=Microbacterium sp. TNHR37B TaxID=1775956 RepID=UPI0007B18F76|nr:ABC transporter ATP-binding protein [Microbacterium sp. TNHR37B]KZE89231.1 Glutathione import ATP-binding protein GsiA [Microbacterium sp. TNHR37B]
MNGVRIEELSVVGPAGQVVAPFGADVAPGQMLALIGESGSGKTLSAKSLVGLLPRGFRARGRLSIGERAIDLSTRPDQWRGIRGRMVALLLQDPFTSLSPVHRCGDQIAWTLEAARGTRMDRTERRDAVVRSLAEVNLPERVLRAYPHQLSGGMRQRVAIAAAVASDPQLLIADEPTTALDASNQGEVLDALRSLQDSRGLPIVLISHDLGVVRGRADEVLVMRHGDIVERGRTASVLRDPQHPYTRALVAADPALAPTPEPPARESPPAEPEVLVSVRGVDKSFGERTVLSNVDLEIPTGVIAGIVGESGSGKSTLARCIAGLEREDGGTISFAGAPLAPGRRSRMPGQMQIVFQDPYSSLNPMMTIGAILREALRAVPGATDTVAGLLETVGLPAEFATRRPADLSGGQRQRVAIARALAPRPRLLICDESVSALDVSVQAQILALFRRLRDERGITLLFISHDLAVVRTLADTVTVMWEGKVVEHGACADVLGSPRHPFTQTLVAAALLESTGARHHDGETAS